MSRQEKKERTRAGRSKKKDQDVDLKELPYVVHKLSYVYLFAGFLCLWKVDPFGLVVFISLPLNFLLMKIYPGRIPVWTGKNLGSAGYDFLFISQVLPLIMVSNYEFQLFDYSYPIILSVIVGLFLTFACIRTDRKIIRKAWDLPALFAAVVFYIFGSIWYLNGALDSRPPTKVQGVVLEKSSRSRDFSEKYYLDIHMVERPVHFRQRVNEEVFDRFKDGDQIGILEYPGFLGMSWYRLGDLTSPNPLVR